MTPHAGDGSTVRPGWKVQVEKVIMEGRREGDEVGEHKEQEVEEVEDRN